MFISTYCYQQQTSISSIVVVVLLVCFAVAADVVVVAVVLFAMDIGCFRAFGQHFGATAADVVVGVPAVSSCPSDSDVRC